MGETTPTNCTKCGVELDEEEREDPRLDSDGDPICDDCYREDYQFMCCICQDFHDDTREKHSMIIVFEDVHGTAPGVYEIIAHPYYYDCMIDAGFYDWALRRIGDVPDGAEDGWAAAGHMCLGCQEKIRAVELSSIKVTGI